MKATVKWVEDALFIGEPPSGHAVVMDGPPHGGGRNRGVRPMEMLLLGMGGCSAYDVVDILRKGRRSVTGCEVELRAERAAAPPKVFTAIHLHFRVSGDRLTAKRVQRAVRLSAEKYCSATLMLAASAAVTHSFEVVDHTAAP